MKSKNYIYKISVIIILSLTTACEDFIQVDPPRTDLTRPAVFADDATATAAVLGIYAQMVNEYSVSNGSTSSVSFLAALSSDEIINVSGAHEFEQFNTNALVSTNARITQLWSEFYQYIYKANAVLEGLESSGKLTVSLSKQLQGEAKFIRAFSYFYLVNFFGDIPLLLTTDYKTNSNIPRTSSLEVYDQIITDLSDAKDLLNADYSAFNDERVRASKGAATALLARVYLYIGDWSKAEEEASAVIANQALYELVGLSEVFLKNNVEAIFQLGNPDIIALDIVSFDFPIFRSSAFQSSLSSSFEGSDTRNSVWVNSMIEGNATYFYATKYKNLDYPPTEYTTVLRLAELYLIRAEARARQNNIAGAQFDINAIRSRAGLPDTGATDQASLILAVEQERKVELFTEWGHRWLDLKRSGNADIVLSPFKPDWVSTAKLYPIPSAQILNNPAMRDAQNPGYD